MQKQSIERGTHLVETLLVDMRSGAGFTLIEALIVVGLVAIVAGATAPIVAAGMSQYTVTSASHQVASTIRAARFQAVGRNTNVRVVFDLEADAYETEFWDTGTASWQPLNQEQPLTGGVSFDAAPANVEFGTDGRMPAGAAAATISVTNGNANQNRTVAVATNGRVQLQ